MRAFFHRLTDGYIRFVEKQGFPIIVTLCVAVITATALWTSQREDPYVSPTPPVVDNISAASEAISGSAMRLGMVHYLSMIFGVLGSAALVLFVFYGSYRTNVSQVLSFCIPVYFVFETLIQYFDKTTAIDSPLKVLVQLAFVSYAVFTTFDSGVYLGKEKMLPKYVFSCMAAVVVGGTVSLATLVCQFVRPECFDISVVESCMSCAFFVLAAAKLHHIAFSIKPEKKEKPAELAQAEESVNG